MDINVSKAADLFFPNPSLELVYFEAIANAIDAGATNIKINISIKDFQNTDSLSLEIIDNGKGFTEENFSRFKTLLENPHDDHKGIGRLVFLKYFSNISITSQFESKIRKIEFDNKFEGDSEVSDNEGGEQNTTLIFNNYLKDRIKAYDYVKPKALKQSILFHFFPLLYQKKLANEELSIEINLTCTQPNVEYGFFSDVQSINLSDLPKLEEKTFKEDTLNLIDDFTLYYSVVKKELGEDCSKIIAVCVDGRTIPMNLPGGDSLPQGYEMIFLLISEFLTGKADSSRQELNLTEPVLKQLKRVFKNKVGEIILECIPEIIEKNETIKKSLEHKYPHLTGYFENENLGLMDRNVSLEAAQAKFFQDQKSILEAGDLTEEQYNKSLDVASRLLMEYVLYRDFTIQRLNKIDYKSSEQDFHDIIIPRRTRATEDDKAETLFKNNVWVLDDKFMTFSTILSEHRMDDLMREIAIDGETVESDGNRPDVAIVFSNDPDTTEKVDVVIIELKKLNLGLAKQEEVVSQLKQRARKLFNTFPDRIQRIWFYGVAEIDQAFEWSLREEKFIQIYSKGKVYYKEHDILPEFDSNIRIPVGLFVLSHEALIHDAAARNSTFMEILKSSMKP